jgi:hypothetical protein
LCILHGWLQVQLVINQNQLRGFNFKQHIQASVQINQIISLLKLNKGCQPIEDGIKLNSYALDSMWTGISDNDGLSGSR